MIPTLQKAAILSVATVVLALLPAGLQAQEGSSPGNSGEDKKQFCSVEGTVVRKGTDEPLSKARIVLSPQNSSVGHPFTAITGTDGRFSIDGITPGRYEMYAERSGYGSKSYGVDEQSAILTLTVGHSIKDLIFRLERNAAISGRVVDENGTPAQGISVEAVERYTSHGKVSVSGSGSAETNDLGEYRIFDLRPGCYYIRATVNAGGTQTWPDGFALVGSILGSIDGYVPSFYGGSADISRATAVDVKSGDEVSGVDLSLTQERSYRMTGQVVNGVTGSPAAGAKIIVVDRDDPNSISDRRMTDANGKSGSFELRGLTPGNYLVYGQESEGQTQLAGVEDVAVVDADVTSIRVILMRGIDIPGKMTFVGTMSPSRDFDVYLHPTGSETLSKRGGESAIKPDGTFTLQNVFGGAYEVEVVSGCDVCYLKSATYNGVDVLSSRLQVSSAGGVGLLELVYSSNSGTVDGVVARDDGLPAVGANVVLVPDAPRRDRTSLYASGTTDQYGRFSIPGVTPGKYKAFAWKKLADNDPEDPEFLRPFEAKGERVSIAENGKQTIQLKLLAGDGGTPEK
jgi:protocatechuate 3,4-dioxygenase beta subunit